MRGANEVREHPWLKYYPWKDLYEKNLEAPFQHKIAEPWDPKYCNAPDKMGLDTKERYENIMRSENFRIVFHDYFFYLNAFDQTDVNNPKESRILPNNHNKLQNGIPNTTREIRDNQERENTKMSNSKSQMNIADSEEKVLYNNNNFHKEINSNYGNPNYMLRNSSSQIIPNSNNLGNHQSGLMYKKIEGTNDIKVLTNIDSKFSKIKQMSNSGSASSLLRQYRVSGISSYSGTGQNQNHVSNFSSIMSQNNKSLVGSFHNSNNSTSTSNQNHYSMGSNQGSSYMRKSGSASYLGK